MHTILDFIESCIRRDISNKDLSLLIKLFLNDRNISPIEYFNLLEQHDFNESIQIYLTIYKAKSKLL